MRFKTLAVAVASAAAVMCLAAGAVAQVGAPAWLVEAEYLYWNTRHSPLAYSGVLAFADPLGPNPGSYVSDMVETKYDWNSGLRIAIGRRLAGGCDVVFRYTFFENDGDQSLGDPTVDSDSYLAHMIDRTLADNAALNGLFDDGQVDFAQQNIRFQYHVYDLELGRRFEAPSFSVRPFGGLRFAEITQGSGVVYQNLEPQPGLPPQPLTDLDTYELTSSVDMRAWGIRIGAEADVPLGFLGLSVFGRGGASLMMSEFNVQRLDVAYNQSLDRTQTRFHRQSYNVVVPQAELAIGLRYERGPFFLMAGYEITHWFNMYQHFDVLGWDDIDGATTPVRADRGDLSLDGLFLNAGFTF